MSHLAIVNRVPIDRKYLRDFTPWVLPSKRYPAEFLHLPNCEHLGFYDPVTGRFPGPPDPGRRPVGAEWDLPICDWCAREVMGLHRSHRPHP